MDQLESMRVFVMVAKLGSFSEAARRLRLSASVVTRTIAQLEERLDQTLLSRTTRSVRLTERGTLYVGSCEQILADVETAERCVRGESAEPRGELKLTAPIMFGRLHVLPIIGQLLAAHPALRIRLTLSDRNAHLVEDGYDAAIRVGELADSSLIAVKLTSVTRVVVASPAYVKRRGAPATPADLVEHDLIGFEGVDATDEWRFRSQDPPVRVAPRFVVNSADAALAAAEAGVGITRALSYQVQDSVEGRRLVRLLDKFHPGAIPVSLIYPANRSLAPGLAALLSAVRAHFGAKAAARSPS